MKFLSLMFAILHENSVKPVRSNKTVTYPVGFWFGLAKHNHLSEEITESKISINSNIALTQIKHIMLYFIRQDLHP